MLLIQEAAFQLRAAFCQPDLPASSHSLQPHGGHMLLPPPPGYSTFRTAYHRMQPSCSFHAAILNAMPCVRATWHVVQALADSLSSSHVRKHYHSALMLWLHLPCSPPTRSWLVAICVRYIGRPSAAMIRRPSGSPCSLCARYSECPRSFRMPTLHPSSVLVCICIDHERTQDLVGWCDVVCHTCALHHLSAITVDNTDHRRCSTDLTHCFSHVLMCCLYSHHHCISHTTLHPCITQGNGQQQQQQQRVPAPLRRDVTSAAAPSSNVAQQRRTRHGLPTLPDLPSIQSGQQSMKTYGTRKKPDHGATAVGGWCIE